jgi:hypothetical protein
MTGRRADRRVDTAQQNDGTLVAIVAGAPASKLSGVTFVFTDEQVAYLDERMRLARHSRPMGRVGGSSLHRRRLDGLHTL